MVTSWRHFINRQCPKSSIITSQKGFVTGAVCLSLSFSHKFFLLCIALPTLPLFLNHLTKECTHQLSFSPLFLKLTLLLFLFDLIIFFLVLWHWPVPLERLARLLGLPLLPLQVLRGHWHDYHHSQGSPFFFITNLSSCWGHDHHVVRHLLSSYTDLDLCCF